MPQLQVVHRGSIPEKVQTRSVSSDLGNELRGCPDSALENLLYARFPLPIPIVLPTVLLRGVGAG